MPDLILKSTGEARFVPPEGIADALASGLYEAPSDATPVQVTVPGALGLAAEVPLSELDTNRGLAPESEAAFRGRERGYRLEREHGSMLGKIGTVAENALNEATLGGFGAAADFLAGPDYTEQRLERSETNTGSALLGKGLGLVAPALAAPESLLASTPLGKVTQIGGRIAKAGEGAGTVTKLARAGLGAAFEGGALGIGTGIQELTDSDKPVTWERATDVLSSNFLFGAVTGGAVGVAGKAVELGLSRASKALREYGERAAATADVGDDLAKLDAKGLGAARKAELDAIEAARVPERAKLGDEIAALRKDMKEQKIWLATKDADVKGIQEVKEASKIALDADKQIDRILRSPKDLAENPKQALRALRVQENALDMIQGKSDDLRAIFAKDTSGTRAAALDALAPALERNRGLQQRILELSAEPMSARLTAIEDAKALLQSGGSKASMPEQLLQGTIFGKVTALAAPIAGPLAPAVGALASKTMTGMVFGRLGKATSEAAARTAKAVDAFLNVTKKVIPAAPVLATKVLSSVRYAPAREHHEEPPAPKKPQAQLAHFFKQRSEEIRSQTAYGPNGTPVMRPAARIAMARQLDGIRAASPILADKMETIAARRLEFLAGKLPRFPDLTSLRTGPDQRQMSDMEMRAFARYAAAVEDPGGIEERLAAGTVTPEDAEVMREVYPERLAEIARQIASRIGELRATLPYSRRLALSIFSGVPVDAAMNPQVLAVLQSQHIQEEGTAGGTVAPKAMPAFGSLRSQEKPTASQAREGA